MQVADATIEPTPSGGDTLLCTCTRGCCIDEPVCMIESTGSYADTYYYHYDALGSVVALSDADGDTVEVYEYDVYGQVAASDPNHPNPFLFTGRRYDAETGLYYCRARYYNPSIGRFLQTDPIGYGDGMNVYAYCGNSPISCVDPSGCLRFTMSKISEPEDGWGIKIRFTVYDGSKIAQYKNEDGELVDAIFDACGVGDGCKWLRGLDDVFTDDWLAKQDGLILAGDELTFWYLQAINQLGGGFDLKALEEAGYHIVRQPVPLAGHETGVYHDTGLIKWSSAGLETPSWRAAENWEKMRDGPVTYLAHELQHAEDFVAGARVTDETSYLLSEERAIWKQNVVAAAIIGLTPRQYKIGERHWYGSKWTVEDWMRSCIYPVDGDEPEPWW